MSNTSKKSSKTRTYQRPQVKDLGAWEGITLQVYSVPVDPAHTTGQKLIKKGARNV